MQSVVIHGVAVENPTAVWTQLKNVREDVLGDRTKWNHGGWFDGTHCLANAIRHVARGTRELPEARSSDLMPTAETLLLRAAHHVTGHTWRDIPAFNDRDGRMFSTIQKTIDTAIEWVEPHAKVYSVVIASDVMTKDEAKEIKVASRKAEAEIWEERWADLDPKERDQEVGRFRRWLEGHERRGWRTFWDELADCDGDEECEERLKELSAV